MAPLLSAGCANRAFDLKAAISSDTARAPRTSAAGRGQGSPVGPPHNVGNELMLVCGMSVGFEDLAAAGVRIDRAPLAETVTFLD